MDEKMYRDGRGPGMPNPETGGSNHTLSLVSREQLQITGVVAVDSFDDEEVTLETDMGNLTIRGEELHIKQLDLERGRLEVEGYVNSLHYSQLRQRANRQGRSRGFLERLLR